MNSEYAWKKFLQTGNVKDYLDYKRYLISEEKQGDENGADDHGRHSDKRE